MTRRLSSRRSKMADKKTMYAAAKDSASDFDLSDGIMDKIDQALGR